MNLNSQTVQDVLIAIALVGGTMVYYRGRIPQQNVKNLTALTDTYEKRIKALEDELHSNRQSAIENAKAIADLQGQIKVYKELPLQELADGIKEVIKISQVNANSNQKILEVLQETPLIATEAHDVVTDVHQEVKKSL